MNIEISNRKIGLDYILLIAEMGINHEGSLKPFQMVDAAHKSGRISKHQTHVIEDEMSAEAKKISGEFRCLHT